MTCSSEYLLINSAGVVTNVFKTSCVIISDEVVGFADGSTVTSPFTQTCAVLQTIDFSEAKSLKTIGSYTFCNCRNVKTFDLSKCSNLESIGICAFCNCSSATSIILPEDSKLSNLPGGCFAYCSSLEHFTVPKTIKSIDSDSPTNYGVFVSSLKSINFSTPSSCTKIGNKAFMDSKIEEITLPALINDITGFSFRICDNLKAIYVDPTNNDYLSYEGILLKKNSQQLVYLPNAHELITQNRTLELPDAIKGFMPNCFAGIELDLLNISEKCASFVNQTFAYSYIKKVVIPASITEFPSNLFTAAYSLTNVTFLNSPKNLEYKMFSHCTSLKEFYIPPTVKEIGDNCFEYCSNLKNVYIPQSVQTFQRSVFIACHPELNLIPDPDSTLDFQNGTLYQESQTILKFYIGQSETVYILPTTTTIESGAFQNKNVTTITYGDIDRITTIGEYAFAGCIKLKSIQLPNNLTGINQYTFYQTSLQSINIPNSVEYIGQMAFGYSSLITVSFGNFSSNQNAISLNSNENKLKNVLKNAFDHCSKLKNFELPDSVSRIEDNAFSHVSLTSFRLPSSLKYLGMQAFSYSSIESFSYSQDIEIDTLKVQCFEYMNSLINFIVPESVIEIETNAFHSCESLTYVKLNGHLTIIGDSAFNDLPSLEKVELINNTNLNNLSYLTFNNCPKLKTIDFQPGTTNFKFQKGILYNKDQTEIIIYLKANDIVNIEIPPSVKYIGQNAFSDCSSIKSVRFLGESQIEEIKLAAFKNCISLKTINFPSSLTSIEMQVFQNCDIDIIYLLYTQVTNLKNSVFAGNKHCKQIILPTCLNEISDNAFANTNSNVYVFYHGANIELAMTPSGLNSNAKVYCYDRYNSSTFLGLPVLNEFLCPSAHRGSSYIYGYRSLIFISLIFSNK